MADAMLPLQGFFYNRYPEPKKSELGTETDINLNQQLCYHVVGQPQSQDAVVLACPDQPAWQQGAEVTDDGRCASTLPCCYLHAAPLFMPHASMLCCHVVRQLQGPDSVACPPWQ